MSNETNPDNPLDKAMREDPLGRAKKQLSDLRDHWESHGEVAFPIPLAPRDSDQPGRDWLPEPEWISGGDAFELIRLQCEPEEWAPSIARICQIIADQWDREESGLNYAFDSLPPNHALLEDFVLGSTHWFRALYSLLTLKGAEALEDWEALVSDLYEWAVMCDSLRLRAADFFENALAHHWSVSELSLPEAKQDPIWSFPKALAWIATRDFLALARMPVFCRPRDEGQAVATHGVWKYSTQALGWLHTEIAYVHCDCGALRDFGFASYKHCTCISIAWEELVYFTGGLSSDTPELVFNLHEGWISMTWPDGADQLRFMRRDILERWPRRLVPQQELTTISSSTANGERDCREWLVREFAEDPDKRRSKANFRKAALAAFPGRLTERGFNLRVWPELAREHGRDSAGAKRKS